MSFLYRGKCYFKRWKRYVQEDTEDPGRWTTNCSSLRPGDIVEFNRALFSHFAIYCGNNHITRGLAVGPLLRPIGGKTEKYYQGTSCHRLKHVIANRKE